MRHPIWLKDDYFQLGATKIEMDPAVVELPEEPIVLTWLYRWEEAPLGSVTDLRLEDGEITGEVKWADNKGAQSAKALLEHGDLRLGGYYTEVVRKDNLVLQCRLRAVATIMSFGSNPGATVVPFTQLR